jgi:hypothetical protein
LIQTRIVRREAQHLQSPRQALFLPLP